MGVNRVAALPNVLLTCSFGFSAGTKGSTPGARDGGGVPRLEQTPGKRREQEQGSEGKAASSATLPSTFTLMPTDFPPPTASVEATGSSSLLEVGARVAGEMGTKDPDFQNRALETPTIFCCCLKHPLSQRASALYT